MCWMADCLLLYNIYIGPGSGVNRTTLPLSPLAGQPGAPSATINEEHLLCIILIQCTARSSLIRCKLSGEITSSSFLKETKHSYMFADDIKGPDSSAHTPRSTIKVWGYWIIVIIETERNFHWRLMILQQLSGKCIRYVNMQQRITIIMLF